LAVMDFDGQKTFSNARVLYTPPKPASGPQPAVTFSSFFPNSAGVVFDLELDRPSGAWGYTWNGNTSELWWADLATGSAHRLGQRPAQIRVAGRGSSHRQETLGRRDRPQRCPGHRPEPSRVLPARAGASCVQLARLLELRGLQDGRQAVRVGCPVLRGVLRVG